MRVLFSSWRESGRREIFSSVKEFQPLPFSFVRSSTYSPRPKIEDGMRSSIFGSEDRRLKIESCLRSSAPKFEDDGGLRSFFPKYGKKEKEFFEKLLSLLRKTLSPLSSSKKPFPSTKNHSPFFEESPLLSSFFESENRKTHPTYYLQNRRFGRRSPRAPLCSFSLARLEVTSPSTITLLI